MFFFFCSETLSIPGIRVIFFQSCELEDILRERGFRDIVRRMGIGIVARNFDIRTEIRDIDIVELQDVDI